MSAKRALITGVTGQDGAYLARFLLARDYRVFGTHRSANHGSEWRLQELGILGHSRLQLIEHELSALNNCTELVEQLQPDEIYNLAAQSFVSLSFSQPVATAQVTAIAAINLLEAIRTVNPQIRYYQASSSEMYGKAQECPQTERTPFYPRSPYAVSKLFAHWSTINYREAYGLFATCGILFNHESPLRSPEFVTRKISRAVARLKNGGNDVLELGNLDAKRDWGYAAEYVEGIWKMLQVETPDTFVLATGHTHSVREFVDLCCAAAGIEVEWKGQGIEESGNDRRTGRTIVRVNHDFYRPNEVDIVVGDPSKARTQLGWEAKTDLKTLCSMMLDADLRREHHG